MLRVIMLMQLNNVFINNNNNNNNVNIITNKYLKIIVRECVHKSEI